MTHPLSLRILITGSSDGIFFRSFWFLFHPDFIYLLSFMTSILIFSHLITISFVPIFGQETFLIILTFRVDYGLKEKK